ncbi:ATP-dependent zinc metalloprotease FtsH [Gossypium australe]|uniref:ATP-dependent zinc metalloprotease FtsH n=1 Tax=Gossypium australe TaxID=47621 RepID=A0A5B6VXQ0_9ROSI|nr:ATP-dependent zinc metalloprotease FtsH [Gossypium australe]
MDDLDCNPEQKIRYVGASHVDACRKEFLNLTRKDRSVAEYEAEFLRLSHYARGIDGLTLRVLIAPQKELDFVALVDKAKIANENRERGRNKRDFEPSSSIKRPKKEARVDGLIRVGASVGTTGQSPCIDCGRRHQGECWERNGACLRYISLEHRIRECPRRSDQMQAPGTGTTPPLRIVQQPPRGHR